MKELFRMPVPSRRIVRVSLAKRRVVIAFATFLTVVPPAARALAADLNVLTARTFKPVLLGLADAFQTRTGNTLVLSADSSGGMTARIIRGEEIDLVIAPAHVLDAIAAQGKVAVDSVTPIARSGIGMVVKKGTPPPDISTVAAFTRTMREAPSFAYIDPESGDLDAVYLARLFDRLGIGEAIRRNAILVPGGLTASRVDNGEAWLALQQISELRAVRNVTFAGPLPEEIQNYTVYAGGVPVASRRPAAARALIAFLRGDGVAAALKAGGFDKP